MRVYAGLLTKQLVHTHTHTCTHLCAHGVYHTRSTQARGSSKRNCRIQKQVRFAHDGCVAKIVTVVIDYRTSALRQHGYSRGDAGSL